MALTSFRLIVGDNIGQLNDAIASAIAGGEYPLGPPMVLGYKYAQAVGEGAAITMTDYVVGIGQDYKTLEITSANLIADGYDLYGGVEALSPTLFAVVGVKGLTGGGGSSDPITAADITDASTVGRAVLTAADVAAARTALGLGSLATLSAITSAQITDGTIVNADISASAAIALAKLANVAAGTDGLAAGTLQATFQSLASRIAVLEAAP